MLGCGDGGTEPQPLEPLKPTRVTVVPATAELTALGATVQLTGQVHDQNGQAMAGVVVTWTSGDTTVATVDGSGLVTAKGNGTATLTATAGSASGTATVTVAQLITGVTVTPAADTLLEADTLRLSAVAADANGYSVAGTEFAWASGDTAVLIVDASGLVSAVGAGMATITATASRAIGRAEFTVVALEPTSVAVTPDTLAFTAIGQMTRLAAQTLDQVGRVMTDAAVSWSSADTTVAMVDSTGLVTAEGRGATDIVATAGPASGRSRVTVMQAVALVTLSPTADTIAAGDSLQILAEAHDANGHVVADARFEWTSSNMLVARVDASGRVIAVDEGAATIHASLGNAVGTSQVWVVSPDRAALEVLYEATGGTEWTRNQNWLTDAPLSDWAGIVTRQGRVTNLTLNRNNLRGPIPSELGDLDQLEELLLYDNRLKGPIPPELGGLSDLRILALQSNSLTGIIPPELGGLARLEELYLHRQDTAEIKSLTGPIPPELGNLGNLKVLHLGSNYLTGAIPPELGNLKNLERLVLQWNPLTGPLPPALGSLTNLRRLILSFLPAMSGPIPPEFGNLTNLEVMDLSWSPLSGPIPPELGRLSGLTRLHLGDNSLTGPIPPELANLQNLEELILHGNEFTGPIPPELGGLSKLQDLNLHDAGLTGEIPSELGRLRNLRGLYLGYNHLTGSIPPELGNLDNLQHLVLEHNDFVALTGGIPELQSLSWLGLNENRLTSDGLPPGVFSKLPSLQWLNLRDNQLTHLPAGLFLGLHRIPRLELQGNPGSPFLLTLTVKRTDSQDLSAPGPAKVQIHLPEGAPTDLMIPLSVHRGTISANTAVFRAGADRSSEVVVTQDASSQTGTQVVAGPMPSLPLGLTGIELGLADGLVLFGNVSNRAPVPERQIPSLRMRRTGPSSLVNASYYFRDPDGDGLEYSAVSSDSSVVSVSVAGQQLTISPAGTGSARVTVAATDTGGLTAESSFSVSVRGAPSGSYAIDLVMTDPVSEALRTAFTEAVAYWEAILAGTELPDIPVQEGARLGCSGITASESIGIIDDLVIVASVKGIDGEGGVLARASVCAIRDHSSLPAVGVMMFDVADLERLAETGNLEEVVLHEIGHVLGIGTVWDLHGMLINPSWRDNEGADTHFAGSLAIKAFDDAGGVIYTGGQKVPVDNSGRRGRADSHWRESVLEHELLTPTIRLGVSSPLSAITLQSLADLGYVVDVGLAEPFRLPGAVAGDAAQEVSTVDVGNDVLDGPIIVFDENGNVVRVIRN